MKVRKIRRTKRFQITRNYCEMETVPEMSTSVNQFYGQPHRKKNRFLRSLNSFKHLVFAGFAFEDDVMSGYLMIHLKLNKHGNEIAMKGLRKAHSVHVTKGSLTQDSWPLEPKKPEQIEETQPVAEGQE